METSPWVCTCDCHNALFKDYMWHCMPCCHVCPTCDTRIVTGVYDMHIKDCKVIQEEMTKAIADMFEEPVEMEEDDEEV
jgi:hypothetical protein